MFKTCPHCAQSWPTLTDLLEDPNVRYHGYQASFTEPMKGLFLFGHIIDDCQTTFSVKVSVFAEMFVAGTATIPMNTDPGCKGLCLDVTNHEHCEVTNCVGNKIRRLAEQIRQYPKALSSH